MTNVTKKQALECLDMLSDECNLKGISWGIVKEFIKSVDSVVLKDAISRSIGTMSTLSNFSDLDVSAAKRIINDNIPDTFHTSGECECQVLRDSHAKTSADLHEQNCKIAELKKQLENISGQAIRHEEYIDHLEKNLEDELRTNAANYSGVNDKYAAIKNMSDDEREEILKYALECSLKFHDGENDNDDTVSETKPEQLPTKADLLVEMQNVCDVINPKMGGVLDFTVRCDCGNMQIAGRNSDGYFLPGKIFKYGPEVEPPPRDNVVIDDIGARWVSTGKMTEDGLEVVENSAMGCVDHIDNWFDIKTGQHSENWQDEWTPAEFKNKC